MSVQMIKPGFGLNKSIVMSLFHRVWFARFI